MSYPVEGKVHAPTEPESVDRGKEIFVAKHTCPCCSYKTLDQESPGSFEVCPICYWEDDNLQFEMPDLRSGANHVSLRQAQANFLELGVSDIEYMSLVRRPGLADERDPCWRPLAQG